MPEVISIQVRIGKDACDSLFVRFLLADNERLGCGRLVKYAFMNGSNGHWFEIKSLDLTLPRLGMGFEGLRLVQISDIHFGTYINRERLETVVETVNRLSPDLIVFTGDLVSDTPERYSPPLVDCLSRLSPKYEVLAVRGNHDHWTDAEAVTRILEESGIVHLENSVYTLAIEGDLLHVAGLDCHFEGFDRMNEVLGQIPETGAAILLVHEPDFADLSARTKRFDVQLSGHSHGGQLIIPGYGPLFLPKFARKYPLGLYRINGMLQYTNRGIGTSHLRLRINCPAEISLFTLHAGL